MLAFPPAAVMRSVGHLDVIESGPEPGRNQLVIAQPGASVRGLIVVERIQVFAEASAVRRAARDAMPGRAGDSLPYLGYN
jgi:hypothetical protein